MQVTPAIKQRVLDKIKSCIEIIDAKYKTKLRFPVVLFDKRGTVAGTANYSTWTINLNATLLMENVEAFIARTVPHELAHLACDKIYPEAHRPAMPRVSYSFKQKRPKREVHGARWQEIMLVLGCDPKRCHSYDVSNSKVQKSTGRNVEWRCGCGQVLMLSEKKSALLRKNPHALWHRGHKGMGMVEVKAATPAPAVRPCMPAFVPNKPVYALAAQTADKRATEAAGSKLEKCANLYVSYQHLGRQMLIAMFVQEAGCTPAGAATYYATMKKRYA